MGKHVYIPHFTTSFGKPTLLQTNLFKGQTFRNRTTIPHSEGQPTFNVEGKLLAINILCTLNIHLQHTRLH